MSESSSTTSTESDSPSSVKKFRVWNPALDDEKPSSTSPKSEESIPEKPAKSSPEIPSEKPSPNQFMVQAAALNTYLQQMAMAAPLLAKLQQQNGKIRPPNDGNLLRLPLGMPIGPNGGPMALPGLFPPPGFPMIPPGFPIPSNGIPPFSMPRLPILMAQNMPPVARPQTSSSVAQGGPNLSMNPLTQAVLTGKSLADANPNVCGFCNAEFKLVGDLTQHLRDNHRKRRHNENKTKSIPGSSGSMVKNLSMRS